MRSFTRILLISITVLSLLTAGLSVLYTREVSEELTALRRESRSDTVYLRCRVRDLESELRESLRGHLGEDGLPAEDVTKTSDGTATPPMPEDTPDEGTSASDAPASPEETVTEAVTLPVHHSPETSPSDTEPASAALYLICEHGGIIGVFDRAGKLTDTRNVLVMTLPRADRDALTVGIPVFSEEELEALLEKYE
jgi:hypothetical protein